MSSPWGTMAISFVIPFVKEKIVDKEMGFYLLYLSALMPFDTYFNVTLITKKKLKKKDSEKFSPFLQKFEDPIKK